MSRALLLLIALSAWLPSQSGPASQESAASRASRYVSASRVWSIVLPDGWRQLTPDEARKLRAARPAGLPEDLLHPYPGVDYGFGPVGEWLLGRADGTSLSVREMDHEPFLDDQMLTDLRAELTKGAAANGVELDILRLERAQIGPDRFPVALVEARVQVAPKGPFHRTLEIYAPTAGRLVALRFRAPEATWEALAPRLRESLDTVTFAQPADAKKSEGAGSKILWAAVLGGLAGLVLVQVRKRAQIAR